MQGQSVETKSKNKRECEIFAISMINLFKAPKSFLEIGFNAGHSLSLFLHNIPSIEMVFEFETRHYLAPGDNREHSILIHEYIDSSETFFYRHLGEK